MAAALPFIAAAGVGLSILGANKAARAQANAAQKNEAFDQANAQVALQQGELDVTQQRQVNYRRLSGIRAATGASGIAMDGSALDVLESSAANAELDVQNIRYNAALKAKGYYNSADLDHARIGAARAEGMYRSASSALIGGAHVYGMTGVGTPVPGLVSNNYVGDLPLAD